MTRLHTKNENIQCILRGHKESVSCVFFTESPPIELISGDLSGTVIIWDLSISRPKTVLSKHHPKSITHLCHYENNNQFFLISQGREGTIQKFFFSKSETTQKLKMETHTFCSFSSNKNRLIFLSDKSTLSLRDVNDFTNELTVIQVAPIEIEIKKVPKEVDDTTSNQKGKKRGMVLCLFIEKCEKSEKSEKVLENIFVGYESGCICVYGGRVVKKKIVYNLLYDVEKVHFFKPVLSIFVVKMKGKGKMKERDVIISGGAGKDVIVTEVVRKDVGVFESKEVKKITFKNEGINSIMVDEYERIFVTGGWDYRIRVFDLKKKFKPLTILKFHTGSINTIDIMKKKSKEKKGKKNKEWILASGSKDKRIVIWSLNFNKKNS